MTIASEDIFIRIFNILTPTESEHPFEKCRRMQIDKNRQNFPSFIFEDLIIQLMF